MKLRLRAGVVGFEAEPDLTQAAPIEIPTAAVHELRISPARLRGLQVRDRGLEPLLFKDDWAVIDTGDTRMRSREVYAVNWDGEAVVAQLVQRGGQWYLNFLHPDFSPINVRSGRMNVVGRVVYQPGRLLTGRL